jgi:hypothetical protein
MDDIALDTELLADIGHIVVNAAMLEYAIAELIAITEGLRGAACQERAVEVLKVPGEAMRLFKDLAGERPGFRGLYGEAHTMLGARHFIAHSVVQEPAVAEGRPALFILQPRHGETMITAAQARKNAQMIREGVTWIQKAIAEELAR